MIFLPCHYTVNYTLGQMIIRSLYSTLRMYKTIPPNPTLVINLSPIHTFSLSIEGRELKEATFTKLLGLTFNNNLTWGNHVSSITTKVLQNLRLLFNIRHLADFKTAYQILQQFYTSMYNLRHFIILPSFDSHFNQVSSHFTKSYFEANVRLAAKAQQRTLCNSFIAHSTNILPLHLSTYFACI